MAKVRLRYLIFTLVVTCFFTLSLQFEFVKGSDDVGSRHHGVGSEAAFQDGISDLHSKSTHMEKFQAILDMAKLAEKELSKADYNTLCERAIGEVLSIEEQINNQVKKRLTKRLDGVITAEEKQHIIDAEYTTMLQKSLDRLTMFKEHLIEQTANDNDVQRKRSSQSTLDTIKSTAMNQLDTINRRLPIQQSLNKLSSLAGQLMTTKPDKVSQTMLDIFESAKLQFIKGTDHDMVKQALLAFSSAKEVIVQVDYQQLPVEIKDWILAHPYQTAFHVANGIVYFYPPALAGPLLWTAGLGRWGVRAGSIAAKYQATFGGYVPARGVLAYLQSAAQGGYGAQTFHTLIKAGPVLTEALKLGANQLLKGAAGEGMTEEIGDKAFEEKGKEAMPKEEELATKKTKPKKGDEL